MATEVTIKIRAFPYYTEEKDLVTGNKVRREHIAVRGEKVKLSDADYQRALQHQAIVSEADAQVAEAAGVEPGELDVSTASIEELANWIKEDGPTINEVIEAAGDDPEVAARLLDAENLATGNEPRKGLKEGLIAVTSRSGSGS